MRYEKLKGINESNKSKNGNYCSQLKEAMNVKDIGHKFD